VTNGKYAPARHLRLLNRKLIDLASRRLDGLAVYMPPRHAKSTTCSHYFPAWYLGAYPEERVILSAYNAGFAASWGRKVRDVVNRVGADGDQRVFDIRVRGDSSAADEWELADTDGGMLTAGVGGGITGRGANVLIIDDPVKDAEEAFSATVRQKHKDWYDSTADTRLEPGAVELLVMTRWHPDDLSAHVVQSWRLAGRRFEELRLPALAEDHDPLGRSPGEALWPERYPVAALHAKRAKGAYWWSALYQQNPAPREGSAFKRDWLRYYTRHGTGYCLGDGTNSAQVITAEMAHDRFLTVDTAAKVKEKAKSDPDYTVVSAWALARGRLIWLGCARAQLEIPDIPPFVMRQLARHRARRAFVEGGGTQKGVAQLLRRLNPSPNVVEMQASGHGDKLTRAHEFLIMAEAGNVWLSRDDPEFPRDTVEFELLSFTGDGRGHDDIWDTAGMAGRVASKHALASGSNSVPRFIRV
jgi:predicted phage terminase large subunit-like protein